MIKFVKNLLLFIIIVLVAISIYSISFINSIEYSVTESDLPQDVYTTSGDLLAYAKTKIVSLIIASDEDKYTITEEFLNLIMLDSIHKNVNEDYDPLGDCTSDPCESIYSSEYFSINYAYAKLNDSNQIVITISGNTNKILDKETALIMIFNVDFNILDMNVVFTLDKYSLGEREFSKNLLDRIFNYLGKESIENSVSFGELNLTDYTYTISISDAMS